MVMLFTEEQRLLNKRHDDAWADIYQRFPDAEHEQKRALFLEHYPDVDIDFRYPTITPFTAHSHEKFHRRRVKIPIPFNDDVERLLNTDQFNLFNILGDLIDTQGHVAQEHLPKLREAREKIDILSHILRYLPAYDAEFEEAPQTPKVSSHSEAIQVVDAINNSEPADSALYLEGYYQEVSGLYRVFPSDLPRNLAMIAEFLVEFVDETIHLLETEGIAYVERDNSL